MAIKNDAKMMKNNTVLPGGNIKIEGWQDLGSHMAPPTGGVVRPSNDSFLHGQEGRIVYL